jgi:hypothetical protein
VVLREPQGDRAVMPAERKPGFVSGVDMLSKGETPLPVRLLSQLFGRRCGICIWWLRGSLKLAVERRGTTVAVRAAVVGDMRAVTRREQLAKERLGEVSSTAAQGESRIKNGEDLDETCAQSRCRCLASCHRQAGPTVVNIHITGSELLTVRRTWRTGSK